jgi:hypothetical protein
MHMMADAVYGGKSMMQDREGLWDASLLIRLIGGAVSLVGLSAAFIGPIEIYTFYLFTEGGRFHYPGFGFGSLMFGNITIQVIGYYVIAVICLPLGVGHLRLRGWSRKLTLALLWDWLILGLPLSVIIFLMLVTSKDPSPGSIPVLLFLFLLLYPVLPVALILLYRSRGFRAAFDSGDAGSNWIDRKPLSVLVLGTLLLLFVMALHVPTLFNAAFPLFGRFLYELDGMLALDVSIMALALLTGGVLTGKRWAWWGTAAFLGLMTLSSIITFLGISPQELLANMRFASLEMDALRNVPLKGYHLVFLISLPLCVTFVPLVLSRKHLNGAAGPAV